MKLYILKKIKNNEIIAITESKYAMKIFCLQIDFNEFIYSVDKITSKEKINKYLVKYSDLYLFEYEDFIIREMDYKIIEDLIYNQKKYIKNTIKSLETIINEFNLNLDEQEIIYNSKELLSKKIKNKRFNSFINLKDIIKNYYNNTTFRDYMSEIYQRYN